MTASFRTPRCRRQLWLLFTLLICALPALAGAQEKNRLLRIKVQPHRGYTRINLVFQSPPDFSLNRGVSRVRIEVHQADAPGFRKLRSYADANVAGIFCSSRQGWLQVTVPTRQANTGVELIDFVTPNVLSLDVGPALKRPPRADIAPGREPILSGIEQFVRDFGTAPPSALPFVPTDLKTLKRFLPENEVDLFQRAEGALYKEQGSEALELLGYFADKAPAVKALAGFRSAQALFVMERYDEALKAYQAAAALWPEYPEQAPELLQMLADLKAKSGDFKGGRALLLKLIDRMSGTAYSGPLMNRLADLTARHGDTSAALELYRSVVVHAAGTPAAERARMKLVDRDLFRISRDRYQELLEKYQKIYAAPCDFTLRDEALFKIALMQGLYGPARSGLDAAIEYQLRYPRGIFSTIVKKMREELLLPVYRELYAGHRDQALVKLALDNKEYLCRCLADPEFAPRVAEACRKAGLLSQELTLFGYLVDRSWAAGSAPFMLARLVEDALTLGNLALAQSSAQSFLTRFPKDPHTQRMHEILGRIAFEQGDLKRVGAELSFLNQKGRQAQLTESNYYLGKAFAAAGDQPGAEKTLSRFLSAPPEKSPLLADAYLTLAGARASLKEYPGALAAYREGLKVASGEGADQMRYKMGEIYLQLKMIREAKGAWDELVKKSPAGTWGKLAAESLTDLAWRLKIAGELP